MATPETKVTQQEEPLQDGRAAEAKDAAAEATASLGIEVGDTPYSLELSQDQKDIREWAHGFAEQVVRPAAHEWDEREEFPWPVVQEAAKIGLYGFES
ncbi:MAG TPA: acyl-CoA dehydrogenase family protein, partial [Solirubrobacterales bacterium]|nr:acyl-CoA dehydrogenase family protein [Solirubrobacterales bacterium]